MGPPPDEARAVTSSDYRLNIAVSHAVGRALSRGLLDLVARGREHGVGRQPLEAAHAAGLKCLRIRNPKEVSTMHVKDNKQTAPCWAARKAQHTGPICRTCCLSSIPVRMQRDQVLLTLFSPHMSKIDRRPQNRASSSGLTVYWSAGVSGAGDKRKRGVQSWRTQGGGPLRAQPGCTQHSSNPPRWRP